jgi:CBS domain-containing protein
MSMTSTMGEAATVLARHGHKVVAVFDHGKLEGLLTRGDVLRYFFQTAGRQETEQRISAVMNRAVVAASPEALFIQALEIMEQNNIKNLPVVDKGQLLGMVHEAEVLRGLCDALQFDYCQMQEYIDHLHQAGQD